MYIYIYIYAYHYAPQLYSWAQSCSWAPSGPRAGRDPGGTRAGWDLGTHKPIFQIDKNVFPITQFVCLGWMQIDSTLPVVCCPFVLPAR